MFSAVILIHPVLASYDTHAFWAGATVRKPTSLLELDILIIMIRSYNVSIVAFHADAKLAKTNIKI